ncbi:MAG: lipopolysaccharide biosynthesis protein [Syntrophaceae bacterium]
MSNRSLTSRTLGGLLWISSGSAAHAVLSTIIMIVQARFLTPTEFGIVGAAMIVIGFSQIFSQLGIGPAIVQRSDLAAGHIRVGFTVSFILGCLVGVLFYVLAHALAVFFRMEDLAPVIKVMALIFPITGLSVTGQSLLQRTMQFKTLALIDVFSYALFYGALGIVLAVTGWGVWALVFAQIGQAACTALIMLVMHHKKLGFRFNASEMGELMNYGLGFSLARIANYAATQADNLVVGRWMGPAALGIYGRAYQFLMMPATQLGTVADKVLFPVMSAVQQDKPRLARAYTTGVAFIAMMTMPLSGVLIVLAPEIIYVLLGKAWMAVAPPFQLLALALVFRTSYKMSDSLARATGAVYRRAWRQWVYAAAVFSGAWIGQFWGLSAVAFGVALAILVNFLLMFHLTASIVRISWRELGIIHLRHFVVACVVSGAALAVKMALLSLGAHPAVILAAALIAAALMFLGLWFGCRSIFGDEGRWAHELAKRSAAGLLKPLGLR